MTRQLGALLFCVAIAACGGGKKGQTTPTGGGSGSDDQSMRDPGDPGGAGGGTGTGAGGAGNPGGGGGPTGPGGTGGGTTAVDGPPIIPPNLDSDPAQVKSAVDGHLAAAKSSLSSNPPDADGALRAAREALKLDATNVDAGAYVAFAYYHKRLYDTAELVLDELLKRDKENGLDIVKKNANVNYVYGLIYDKKNQPERAFRAFQMAVELDGRHASALVNLGVHQLRNSQYSEAQRTFERLTKEFGRTDAVTLTSLGSAYRGRSADYPQGAPERDQFVRSAEAAYKRALQANSAYGPAYYNLGLLYLDTDPYPGVADTLLRLNTAKQYFDQYKNMPNFDVKLYESRTKDVDRAIKRAQKKQKKPKSS